MINAVVVRPWLEGQKVGDMITLKKLHPSLVSHVRLINSKEDEQDADQVSQTSENDKNISEEESQKPDKPESNRASKKNQ